MNKKTFVIDIDSIDECKSMFMQLKSIMGQLQANKFGSRNQRKKEMFDACMNIFNTDISSVYSDVILDPTPVYYVYTHAEPNRHIAIGKCGKSTFAATLGMRELPFYVGKGTGNRAYELNRNETHRKIRQKLHNFNQEISVTIIRDGLTELEALMMESKLIDIFGLIATGGRLVNLDEGVNSKERQFLYKSDLAKLSTIFKNSVDVDLK